MRRNDDKGPMLTSMVNLIEVGARRPNNITIGWELNAVILTELAITATHRRFEAHPLLVPPSAKRSLHQLRRTGPRRALASMLVQPDFSSDTWVICV
jgi:hypothetical protein